MYNDNVIKLEFNRPVSVVYVLQLSHLVTMAFTKIVSTLRIKLR